MKYLLSLVFACLFAVPLYAGVGDNVSAYISTTTATIYEYPCNIDGFYVFNSSNVAQTVIIYDNATEVFRGQVAASTDKEVVNFTKKINTSIKATSSNENTGANHVKLHVNIK
jgi:hypothetical protein